MGSCFASYLVIPRGLNLSGRSKLRSQGEKAEAVVDAYGGGLLPPQLFNLLAGVVAAL
jgi:hypothetical protein